MDSSTTDQLKFANPAWVRRVAVGLLLIIPGIVGHIIAAFLRWMITNEARTTIHIFSAAFLIVAVFVTTWKEPGTKRGQLSLWARIVVVAALGFWIGLFLVFQHEDFSIQVVRALILPCAALPGGALLPCWACIAVIWPCASRMMRSTGMRFTAAGWSPRPMACSWGSISCSSRHLMHFMFFMCSFPMIGGLLVIFMWAVVTLVRLALNLRLVRPGRVTKSWLCARSAMAARAKK